MPKAKVARKSTAIDMTPMVDLAFLLITFFMLTVKFRPQEAVTVILPPSIATTPVPNVDLLTILIGEDGKVYMGVSDQNTRRAMLEAVAQERNITFTEEEKKKFAVLEQVPVPIEELKRFLALRPSDREAYIKKSKGVPVDSADNQLQMWMLRARLSNPNLRIAIKADEKTPYPAIRQVIKTLKKQKANRFNLVTIQEADPRKQKATSSSQS
ncbi:MAG: biopolymer transporter ExbD [Bacteroidia bacterium]|nr:biopolymer transporter ExbD [Bacteroidia bacterium]MDW8159525.1 biopolymer transporter ExbD [Bacteroidia bacterium]